MGVSRMTVWAIQENPSVHIFSGQDPKTQKWAGFVGCTDAKDRPRILLSTEPTYNDESAANRAMEALVAEIKTMKV